MKLLSVPILLCCLVVCASSSLPVKAEETLPPASKHVQVAENEQSAPPQAGQLSPDLLLINPTTGPEGGKNEAPLKSLVGSTLKMSVARKDIVLDGLHGLSVSITNDTDRPIVIDCLSAKARLKEKDITSADIFAVQNAVQPKANFGRNLLALPTKAVPAFFTIGAIPTVHDIFVQHGPIFQRYGADQARRRVELGRFGLRILWPNQETTGIVYFKTHKRLTDATVELAVHTLFNPEDAAEMSRAPASLPK